MKILGTGLSGLVGSRIVQLLSPDFSFNNLSLETNVDITDGAVVHKYVKESDAPWVFHFAARTDVDGAEKETGDKAGSYWITNVEATRSFVEACKEYNKKLLYISTDYVFDGTEKVYTESSIPHPLGWYGVTKYEGEKLVGDLGENSLIVRIANPYCAQPTFKPDFIHKIASQLKEGKTIQAPTDQLFVPTFIDEIARAIGILVRENATGIYHAVGSSSISPYDAGILIAKTIGASPSLVQKTTFEVYFEGRAKRPRLANTSNAKIVSLGAHMSTFEQGLAIISSYL